MPQKTKVQALTVGPIVGATTASSVRIWGRGVLQQNPSGLPKRCFGVARIRRGGGAYGEPWFFKMNPNFDMTGLAVFDQLAESSGYSFQIGWFPSDGELDDPTAGADLEWRNASRGTFATGSGSDAAPRSIVFGSCRYLLRLFGSTLFDGRGDKTFRSIAQQIDGGHALDFLLMIGDQIYADDLNKVAADESFEEYTRRYRKTFSQEHIRGLMGRVPTYMVLDDHEIEDNWPESASSRDWLVKYPNAIQAYQAYQACHSPLLPAHNRKLDGVPERFWYTFRDGCCDVFVMDTRTERDLDEAASERQMVSEEQMAALLDWLDDGSGRAKLVATSVPFFPDYRRPNKDKWSGFLGQRTRILDFIRDKNIAKVVFLSGDVHCSMSAELVCPSWPTFKVISVVSSSFFWPYPHPRRRKFALEGLLPSVGPRDYRVENAGPVVSRDNFTRLTVRPDGLDVEVFGRKGKPRGSKQHAFSF